VFIYTNVYTCFFFVPSKKFISFLPRMPHKTISSCFAVTRGMTSLRSLIIWSQEQRSRLHMEIFQKSCWVLKTILFITMLMSLHCNFNSMQFWKICAGKVLSHYLEGVEHPKHDIVMKLKLIQLTMPSRSSTNVTNCGIFCMRHMESFFWGRREVVV